MLIEQLKKSTQPKESKAQKIATNESESDMEIINLPLKKKCGDHRKILNNPPDQREKKMKSDSRKILENFVDNFDFKTSDHNLEVEKTKKLEETQVFQHLEQIEKKIECDDRKILENFVDNFDLKSPLKNLKVEETKKIDENLAFHHPNQREEMIEHNLVESSCIEDVTINKHSNQYQVIPDFPIDNFRMTVNSWKCYYHKENRRRSRNLIESPYTAEQRRGDAKANNRFEESIVKRKLKKKKSVWYI